MAFGKKHKEALKKLRESRGGVSPELKAYMAEFKSERNRILAALKEAGAATVPAIAAKTGVEASRVLLHITVMRKYGQAVEAGVDGDYPQYALAAEEKKEATEA
ncbi:MAG: transcriptional regulator [Verrucomicrobia bacterium]|nr:transcriptional regulator [Verrucomicrobiota bacterium]